MATEIHKLVYQLSKDMLKVNSNIGRLRHRIDVLEKGDQFNELLDMLEQCIGCDPEVDTARHYLLKKHGREGGE